MSYKYAIDSSIWIAYFAGSARADIRRIIEHEAIATSIIAIAELADKFEREDQVFEGPLRFIQSRASILPLTISIAMHAAKLKNSLRKKHEKFGLADGLHLATSMQEKATFVTADKDFSGIGNALIVSSP
jgi:predicted nucleic acid-binding protein